MSETGELEGLAVGLGLPMKPQDAALLGRFEGLLLAANQEMNLTRIVEHREVLIKHHLDSLTALLAIDFPTGGKVVDVGSGGGLPGIPLKVHRPDLRVSLLESSRKKCVFLRAVARELALPGLEVLEGRAEDLGRQQEYRETFDIAVARAVAHLAVLAEICLPLVKVGGTLVAMKGGDGEREAGEAAEAIQEVGGNLTRVLGVALPEGMGDRVIVVIQKVSATPGRFPRKAGIPQKRPLGLAAGPGHQPADHG
ncbi:MAG: 16S rRNA (guanine(527)-N(7))-methyltransferase RsmG [Bacillota bacterium]